MEETPPFNEIKWDLFCYNATHITGQLCLTRGVCFQTDLLLVKTCTNRFRSNMSSRVSTDGTQMMRSYNKDHVILLWSLMLCLMLYYTRPREAGRLSPLELYSPQSRSSATLRPETWTPRIYPGPMWARRSGLMEAGECVHPTWLEDADHRFLETHSTLNVEMTLSQMEPVCPTVWEAGVVS